MSAKIKLNAASGGGSFSLQAPSSSSNNRVFTLPDSADATLLTSTASLGKLLQVQSANLGTSIQITSTSYVTTGVTVNITPTSASSKILIATSFPIYKSGSNAAVDVTLYRDSTNLGDGTYGFGQFANLGGAGGICGVNLQFSDSPNTTSQVTYTVYGKINSGHNFYVMSNNVAANITAKEYST
tara:strand:+ start:103 stop:654 length:552 start_codon:yes stop_codon:yes gene_type:complete